MAGVTFCTVKHKANDELSCQVKDFVNNGGKINSIAIGVSGDKKHPFADAPEFSGKVKASTSKGGKNAAISKRK